MSTTMQYIKSPVNYGYFVPKLCTLGSPLISSSCFMPILQPFLQIDNNFGNYKIPGIFQALPTHVFQKHR